MSVFRINKNNDYTTMSNIHLKDKRISLKAKGLLSEMLSLPDDWNYSIKGLVSINKEEETSIKATLKELQTFKYLIVTKQLPNETSSGRIEYIYDIFEKPKQEVEKQEVENLPLEILPLENQAQYNTNNKILNNKIYNNKKEIYKESNFKEEFEELWKIYPKKVGKKKSFDYYKKARKKTSYETIKHGIENYVNYINSSKTPMQYVKDGSTWFNQECWNDERKVEEKKTREQEYQEQLERMRKKDLEEEENEKRGNSKTI